MGERKDVRQGTLGLMVLKTLQTMGPLHGYGIARRIEQTSGDSLIVQYGTLYPTLLKLEQEGYIASEWGFSENNRARDFTSSHVLAGKNWKKKCVNGGRQQQSWRGSSRRRNSHETFAWIVVATRWAVRHETQGLGTGRRTGIAFGHAHSGQHARWHGCRRGAP